MSEHNRAPIELAERTWGELEPAERHLFEMWIDENASSSARGANLFLLLDFARQRWRRRAPS